MDYICPISLEPMCDPVLAADGHLYDCASIQAWLATGAVRSPLTGLPMEDVLIRPWRVHTEATAWAEAHGKPPPVAAGAFGLLAPSVSWTVVSPNCTDVPASVRLRVPMSLSNSFGVHVPLTDRIGGWTRAECCAILKANFPNMTQVIPETACPDHILLGILSAQDGNLWENITYDMTIFPQHL